MAEETEQTEQDETTEHLTEEPEKGTEGDEQVSESDVTVTTDPDAGGGDTGDNDVDWESKAQLYKAQMRKQEKRAKDNLAETERLRAELDKLKQAPPAQQTENEAQQQQTQADPAQARMDDLAAQLAELKAESDKLKAQNAAAEHSRMIAEIAADKGLTVDQARRLQGDTREELEADADEVIALFGLNKTKSPGPAPKPRERRPQRGGATNPGDTDARSREDILAAVLNTGRRKG